jgi:hypothetical protein
VPTCIAAVVLVPLVMALKADPPPPVAFVSAGATAFKFAVIDCKLP